MGRVRTISNLLTEKILKALLKALILNSVSENWAFFVLENVDFTYLYVTNLIDR
jgi:hypothetical protein